MAAPKGFISERKHDGDRTFVTYVPAPMAGMGKHYKPHKNKKRLFQKEKIERSGRYPWGSEHIETNSDILSKNKYAAVVNLSTF